MLRVTFRQSAGRSWVDAGQYELMDERTGGVLTAEEWTSSVKPGMLLSMAMVIRIRGSSEAEKQRCPSCECRLDEVQTSNDSRVTWYLFCLYAFSLFRRTADYV